MIPRRALGSTGMSVSLLGLGTVKLGRDQAVKYPRPFRIPDDREAAALLDHARGLGINLIDTAPAYGEAEQRLGRLLMAQRNDWLLATKVGERFDKGVSSYDFSPEAVQASVKTSLQRLHTDRLDMVLIHSDGHDEEILNTLGTLECLQDLKSRGWIRAVGISHKSVAGGRAALRANCDVVMATLSTELREEAILIAEAGAQGCGVLVKKALASGHAGPESLAWVAAQPGVSSVIVGTINREHLSENAGLVADL